MMFRKLLWCLTASMALSTSVPASAQEVFKIGVLLPLSGGNADSQRVLRGHELAAKQINDAGGIKSLKGAKIQLVVGDIQSKPDVARSEAERLATRENVHMMVGAFATATTIPAMQVSDRNGVPFIIVQAVTDNLTEQGLKYVFRIGPKAKWFSEEAAAFVEYLNSKGAKISKIALAYEDGPFGQSASANYRAALSARGMQVVAEESFKTGSPDLGTQAAKLKASGAEMVLLASYLNDNALLLRAFAALRYSPMVLGYSNTFLQPALLELGAPINLKFGITDWMPDLARKAANDFAEAYTTAYKESSIGGPAAAFATIYVAAAAAEIAGSLDRDALRKAMHEIKITDGPGAVLPEAAIAFDENGQNKIGLIVSQVIDGKFVTVWPEAYAAKPLVIPTP